MNDREFAVIYAESWFGRFYSWDDDDPSGIDCSGLVVEVLKAVGILPRRIDYSAEGLRQLAVERGWLIDPRDVRQGCLVFWLTEKDGREEAVHVEIVSRHPRISIGASGGGSKVRDLASAIKANAFVKPRPIASRGGKRLFADPFLNGFHVPADAG